MKRSIILAGAVVLLLGAALFAVLPVRAAHAHPSTFPDVQETDPAHNAIESLATQGIVSGFDGGDFRPADPLTRAQAMKMLVAWREPVVSDLGTTLVSSFSDVDGTRAVYVETALARGWVSGYPDGTFRPQASLTREQIAVILIRILELKSTAESLTPYQIDSILREFLDQGSISPGARPYVALAVLRGLLTGDGGRLVPLDPLTRAQFCLLLYRADSRAVDPPPDPPVTTADTTTESQEAPYTADEQALAAFIDTYLFQPHDSPVTGVMVLQNAEWYGIPPLSQLVIMAAETSLGDPDLGGVLAQRNNFGCLRYHGTGTPWGLLSDGRIWAAGKDWYSFPTPGIGMAAFGRYLKAGVDGFYVPILSAAEPDWERFAAVYYGRGVSGFGSYVNRLHAIENRFRAMAEERGVEF